MYYSFIIASFLFLFSSYKSATALKGTVQEGKKEAWTLGYPTANIPLPSPSPPEGVYACWVFLKKTKYKGMCYVDLKRNILEAHLFNYKGNLYGQKLGVFLSRFIRPRLDFTELPQIQNQLKQDAVNCLKSLE